MPFLTPWAGPIISPGNAAETAVSIPPPKTGVWTLKQIETYSMPTCGMGYFPQGEAANRISENYGGIRFKFDASGSRERPGAGGWPAGRSARTNRAATATAFTAPAPGTEA
jgi:hypothetical protein